jgi:uncharacterized membrane protein YobD (UPF0266 family)
MLMNDEQQPTTEVNWQYNSASAAASYDGATVGATAGVPLPPIPEVSWTASEYVAHEKAAGWYAALFAGTFGLVAIIFLITRDILASLVILLACVAIAVYAAWKPGTNKYVINEKGIQIQEKFYAYSDLRSFSVVEEGAIDSIWVKPLKRFTPVVVMYFSPEDEQKIIDVLANFLPHEEHELVLIHN